MDSGSSGGSWRPAPSSVGGRDPFAGGALVIVSLHSPREKFWGAVLSLTPAGLSVEGVDVNSFDDFIRVLRADEPATAAVVFFPMHRVDRIELDAPTAGLPSLGQRFEAATGREPRSLIAGAGPCILVGCTLVEAQRRLVEATLSAVHQDLPRAAELLGVSPDYLKILSAPGASAPASPKAGGGHDPQP